MTERSLALLREADPPTTLAMSSPPAVVDPSTSPVGASPRRSEGEPWYRRAFGPAYLDHYAHRDDREAERVADFLHARLAFAADARLLDLCCGAGRHLAHLAPRAGASFGLDLSHTLLRRASERRADLEAAEIEFAGGESTALEAADVSAPARTRPTFSLVEGDMRRLPFADGFFDVVVNLFTSFGYFEDEGENRRVLAEVARTLRPGGAFAIDHIHRPYLLRHLRGESERVSDDGARVLERREYDSHAARVVKRVRRAEPDGSETRWVESVRVYGRDELEHALEAAGLRCFGACGDYDGSALTDSSPRMILFARRASEGAEASGA